MYISVAVIKFYKPLEHNLIYYILQYIVLEANHKRGTLSFRSLWSVIFFFIMFKSLMLTNAAFIWAKINT